MIVTQLTWVVKLYLVILWCIFSKLTVIQLNLQYTLLVIPSWLTQCYCRINMSDIHWIASTQALDNIVTTLEWICSGSTITKFRAYKLLLLYYYLVQNKLQHVNFFCVNESLRWTVLIVKMFFIYYWEANKWTSLVGAALKVFNERCS